MKGRPEYNGIVFDSPEEREFYWWCEEAMAASLIGGFEYQSPTFVLAEPVYFESPRFHARTGKPLPPRRKTLLQGKTYTCDFHLSDIRDGLPLVNEYIDVKPTYTRRNDTARYFSAVRKWLYQRHQVLVFALKPTELFGQTFAPAQAILTPKQRKPRKNYEKFRSVAEFIDLLNRNEVT